ncbi:MAG: DUF4124 domain-containing protein [Telluria sp.]
MTSVTCRLLRAAPLLALGVALHAQAQSTVYKCMDERGRVELTDTNKHGCKPLDLPGFITTNPPPHPAPAPRTHQGSAPAPASVAPASFPRVGAAEQRARDDDRRAILAEELRTEQQKLVDLKSGFNNGEPARQAGEKDNAKYQQRVAQMRDDIARSEQNIEALKREIANVR